jgi:hypothetical protein
MKKKIKDLTLLEASKICCSIKSCDNCPLHFIGSWCAGDFCSTDIEKKFPNDIEKEVEVEVDDLR